MGKRGTKPKITIEIKWSPNFAYALGLIASDGCIYGHRTVNLTSKDLEQIRNFLFCLKITSNRIAKKGRGGSSFKKYFYTQFGDLVFINFLKSVGITQAKSKTIGEVAVPDRYFFSFLRGVFDGDGTFYSYWDPRWKSSFMFYVAFASASDRFLFWLREKIFKLTKTKGHISRAVRRNWAQLRYAKKDSIKILRKMYKSKTDVHLRRKRLKIKKALGIVGESL